jgi:hypothetical protein
MTTKTLFRVAGASLLWLASTAGATETAPEMDALRSRLLQAATEGPVQDKITRRKATNMAQIAIQAGIDKLERLTPSKDDVRELVDLAYRTRWKVTANGMTAQRSGDGQWVHVRGGGENGPKWLMSYSLGAYPHLMSRKVLFGKAVLSIPAHSLSAKAYGIDLSVSTSGQPNKSERFFTYGNATGEIKTHTRVGDTNVFKAKLREGAKGRLLRSR